MPLKFVTTTIRTDELTAAKPQALGTMALVGTATAGTVGTAQLFRSVADAEAIFGQDSVLTKAIASAFKQDPGPQEIWAVREGITSGNITETKIQIEAGNKAFAASIAPIVTVNAIRARVVPSIIQSKSEDHTGASTIFRQDGAATNLFAGISRYGDGAASVFCVVTDKNHIAVSGATVNIAFEDDPTQAQSSIGPSAVTGSDGVAVFTISGFGHDPSGNPDSNTDDTIRIWSVSGDLDSGTQNANFTTKDGTPDDDVLITWTTNKQEDSERLADDGFVWFSESNRAVYAFIFESSTSGLGGFLDEDMTTADTLIGDASGANIDGGTVVKAKIFSNYGIQATAGTDSTGTYQAWAISQNTTESTSNINAVLKTAPAVTVATTHNTTSAVTNLLNPIIHTFDLLDNMTRETLGAGNFVSAPISNFPNTETGDVFLGEELGLDDLLFLDFDANTFASALNALQNKEFRIISAPGKTSADNLKTFTRFVESRKDYLPAFGVYAMQPKGLVGGNGKDFTLSRISQSNYIKLVAHDHSDPSLDVSSAVGGAMMGLDPWDSSAFLIVAGIINDDVNGFTLAEIDSYNSAQIDVLDQALFLQSISPVLSEGFSTGPRRKSDVQIMLNFVDVEVKRSLTQPTLLGKSRVSFQGISRISDAMEAILSPLLQEGVIGEASEIYIPLLEIFRKDAASRTPTENVLINTAQNTRIVSGELRIDFQGSIEKIQLGIRFF